MFVCQADGHSLGGALAQLAAHDIALAVEACGKAVVPHCWHVINNQDAVAKAPKFLVLYKRAGHRVVINANGDMAVRPSFIENSLNSLLSWHGIHLTGNGVSDHLLGSYLRSLLAIVLAQFDGKGFPGGMDGVVRLVEKCTPIQDLLLHGAGISIEDLRRVSRWHGRVVNPKLTSTTAADVLARVQTRSKRTAKRALTAKAAKEGVEGQAGEAQVEAGPSQGKVEVSQSFWHSLKRWLLIWVVAGATKQEGTGDIGSRSMPAGDSDTSSETAAEMERTSMSTSDAAENGSTKREFKKDNTDLRV
ncbi:hypothetical protein COCOBI_17-3060 [Coccomyxa sp. Obi]|nr:hypothetical protein COCOBI_17-3060 [Coccomyxa sp. Obi]